MVALSHCDIKSALDFDQLCFLLLLRHFVLVDGGNRFLVLCALLVAHFSELAHVLLRAFVDLHLEFFYILGSLLKVSMCLCQLLLQRIL
jgi:hypothetical protein